MIMKISTILFFILSFAFAIEKQIYSTVQMMDQVQIVNPDNLQIEQSVMTEFANENSGCMDYDSQMQCNMDDDCMWMDNHCMDSNDSCMDIMDEMSCNMNDGCEWMMNMCMESESGSCMDYNTEMTCNMSSGCEWMMGMCMESESGSCMDYDTEMTCNMASGCEWMMGMCMESANGDDVNTPHFIALDEENGYWFVTTIASGYIAQFSLLDNSLIDTYFVGDAPALLVVDAATKTVYCSRMMPMNGMGNMMPSAESTIIQSLNYSSMGLSEGVQYEIDSPAPHGLAINHDGSEVYTASNTADWLYKINTLTGNIIGVVMDEEVNNTPDQTTQRLKPIQCLSVDNKLFVSCSAGTWMNPWTGEQTVIPGKLQMWNSDTMELIDTYDFGNYSSPWHIKESPIDNKIYVSLSGDNLYDTEGVASLIFSDSELSLEWEVSNNNFEILHGIDVSSSGDNIYVSGRGDGHIHKLDSEGNYIDNIFLGSMSMLGGLAIEKKGLPELGDLNNDFIINVTDIVLSVSIIFNPMMASPYMNYASDLNLDNMIDVVDVVQIVNLILN